MSRKTHHVVPSSQGGWNVRKGGAQKASKHFDTQKEAIKYAVDVSKNQGSELLIHRKDGIIRDSRSYSNDPNPPKDKR
ncbi:MAG: DUF2188 domain-containing protein [Clostridiales bacterium]|nr:DUF2188 domain-containing protein [Clostridiales bacterium]